MMWSNKKKKKITRLQSAISISQNRVTAKAGGCKTCSFWRVKKFEFVLSSPPIRTVERRAGPTARVAYRAKDVVKEIQYRGYGQKRTRRLLVSGYWLLVTSYWPSYNNVIRRASATEVYLINEPCLWRTLSRIIIKSRYAAGTLHSAHLTTIGH